jgi:FtsZ-binding cell division protein ZapB
VNETLDKLEASLDQAVDRIEQLSLENDLLRKALADAESRMSTASVRLRAIAERLPEAQRALPLQ